MKNNFTKSKSNKINEITSERYNDHSSVHPSNTSEQYNDHSSVLAEIENKINYLMRICENVDIYIGNIYDNISYIEPLFCQLTAITVNITTEPRRWINIKTNFDKFINLKKLSLSNYNYGSPIEIISDTLEILEISSGFYYNKYSFIIPDISKIPKLNHLEFVNCTILYRNNNLMEQLNTHPNRDFIKLVFNNSPYFSKDPDNIALFSLS